MRSQKSIVFNYLHERGLPIERNVIDSFANETGANFDHEIVDFWEIINGGEFYTPTTFKVDESAFQNSHPRDSIEDIVFYSFEAKEWAQWIDMLSIWKLHDTRIPKGTIPIGKASVVDLILYDSLNHGEIYLWERDEECVIESELNRVFLASSITDFITKIQFEPVKQRREKSLFEMEPLISIESHDLESLSKLLNNKSPSTLKRDGVELLTHSCQFRFHEGVQLLLRLGISHTGKIKTGEPTPIEMASVAGAGDIVIMLLDAGADEELLYRDVDGPQEYISAIVEQWKCGRRPLFSELQT